MLTSVVRQLVRQGARRRDNWIEVDSDRTYYVHFDEGASDENTPPGWFTESPLVSPLGASNTYALNLVNRIGALRLGPLQLDVVGTKLSADEFDALVAQVAEFVASLPFSHQGPGAVYETARRERTAPTAYHTFVHVRHLLRTNQLQAAVQQVAADPHIVFTAEREDVRVERARRPDATTVRLLCALPDRMEPLAPGARAAGSAMAKRLQNTALAGHFPGRVSSQRIVARLDNPENQFVRHVLTWALRRIERLRKDEHCPQDVAAEADLVVQQLERLLQTEFFRHVSEARHIHLASQVLQRRRGYRDIFAFYSDLTVPPAPSWNEDAERILELKNAAVLYEYWTFITMCTLIEEQIGVGPVAARVTGSETPLPLGPAMAAETLTRRDQWQHSLRDGLEVHFPRDIIVYFNKTWPGYSGPFRPDVTLHTPKGMWVFDAKFRIRPAPWTDEGGPDDLAKPEIIEHQPRLIERSDDIHKMHTYRDALTHCRAAYVLYPGHRSFTRPPHPVPGNAAGQAGMHAMTSTEDPVFHLDGVGAFAIVPGGNLDGLRTLLGAMLRPSGGRGTGDVARGSYEVEKKDG